MSKPERHEQSDRKAYMKAYHQQHDHDYYVKNVERIKEVKRRRRTELRRWFREDVKGELKCTRCPEDFWACIEFHHNDPTEKEHNLGDMARKGMGKVKILAEIAKCTVLCSNCHKKEHARLDALANDSA